MKKIGVFSGSFNPIHIGHAALASYLCQYTSLDEVWLIVTPENPIKRLLGNATDDNRIAMATLVAETISNIKICTIEFELPTPSYTINTLDTLKEKYSDCEFTLIIGADNWNIINKWKDYNRIISEYGIYVYPRPGYNIDKQSLPCNVCTIDAPIFEISSTFIRNGIASGKNMNYFLPMNVYEYILKNKLYKE